ncbi:EthD family reductase [Leisingera daeponensis]|uniref:EthD family reductase n=1 Tax=Leisingera daeponensis TaxID=405746 RepID=UPI001C96ECCE|nr:EthD family reductase [Leisingera daeponensis]MBY6059405.1 EthD family reductase [Leisingera daeponensis]
MIKMAITLFRNQMTLEEQQRWWLEEHAPIARQMPGLRGYVINLASVGEDGADPDICGTDELLFDDWDAAQRAYNSEEWTAARNHTAESGAKAVRAWIRSTEQII